MHVVLPYLKTKVILSELGDNLYFLTIGAYNTMFMVTEEGAIAVDAPPAIGDKYLKGIQ